MVPDADDAPRPAPPSGATRTPTARPSSATTTGSRTRELDAASRALAARLVAPASSSATASALLAPNGIELGHHRPGASCGSAPCSCRLAPCSGRPSCSPSCGRGVGDAPRSPRAAIRGRDYLADLDAGAEGLPAAVGAGGPPRRRRPRCAALWTTDDLPARPAAPALVAAMEDRVRPADDLAILFTSGSRGAPKGVIHTHGGALRATAAGLDARCVRPGERLYIPMPFFWMGGFGGGLLTVLVAGATLLTETDPEPSQTLRFLERERVTLFRGLARPGRPARRPPRLRQRGPVVARRRQPRRPCSRPSAGRRRGAGEPLRHDRVVRALLRRPARRRSARRRSGGAAAGPSTASRCASLDARRRAPVPRRATGEIWLRGPNLLRGMCGRLRSTVVHRGRLVPHRRPRSPRCRRVPLVHRPARRHVQGEGRHGVPVRGRGRAARGRRGAPGLRHRHRRRRRGAEVAALVLTAAPARCGAWPACGSGSAPSRSRPRWVLAATPDRVPMSATGKVDKRGLQALLRRRGHADCGSVRSGPAGRAGLATSPFIPSSSIRIGRPDSLSAWP